MYWLWFFVVCMPYVCLYLNISLHLSQPHCKAYGCWQMVHWGTLGKLSTDLSHYSMLGVCLLFLSSRFLHSQPFSTCEFDRWSPCVLGWVWITFSPPWLSSWSLTWVMWMLFYCCSLSRSYHSYHTVVGPQCKHCLFFPCTSSMACMLLNQSPPFAFCSWFCTCSNMNIISSFLGHFWWYMHHWINCLSLYSGITSLLWLFWCLHTIDVVYTTPFLIHFEISVCWPYCSISFCHTVDVNIVFFFLTSFHGVYIIFTLLSVPFSVLVSAVMSTLSLPSAFQWYVHHWIYCLSPYADIPIIISLFKSYWFLCMLSHPYPHPSFIVMFMLLSFVQMVCTLSCLSFLFNMQFILNSSLLYCFQSFIGYVGVLLVSWIFHKWTFHHSHSLHIHTLCLSYVYHSVPIMNRIVLSHCNCCPFSYHWLVQIFVTLILSVIIMSTLKYVYFCWPSLVMLY